MNSKNNFNIFFKILVVLLPLFVFSQKEYFPTNEGVKVVNEPYKVFVNATIIINSEITIEKGVIVERDGKIIDIGTVSYTHLMLPTSDLV